MNDKAAFRDLMTGIAEIYGQTITKAGLRVWWAALDQFSDDQVRQALNAHAMDAERGRFMPKPADIVRAIQGTQTDQAQAAWAKVEHAIRRIGGGPSWVFDDPKIHRALEQIGGVSALSNCPSEKDLAFLREQFCKRYASTQDTGPYPARLQGWHASGEPVMIGNRERCQAVLEGGSAAGSALTNASDVARKLVEKVG